MPTVMITGANRGLGLEFTRQYAADGWTVIATCRDPINPGELARLDGDIQVHGLDVTNHPQVDRLAKDLAGTAIDVLINNAGIYGPRGMTPDTIDYAAWEQVMRTNVFAPFKVTTAFASHVAASDQKKVANVSSLMGSNEGSASPGEYVYRSSKAALNKVMSGYAQSVAADGVIISLFHPGWVQTDMGGAGADIDAVTSVTGMRGVIAGLTTADNGRFFNYDGTPLPW